MLTSNLEGREFESLRARHEINGLSPAIYAAQRRSAALRSTDGSAPRTATTTAHRAQPTLKLQLPLDKSWGQRHSQTISTMQDSIRL